jgi:glycosyltransferase involved in cell wall biosynthesis
MGVVLAVDHRFARTPDGAIWAGLASTVVAHAHWTRYFPVFGRVCVLARVLDVARAEPGWRRADGDRVDVHALPYYVGPRQYLRKVRAVRRAVEEALTSRAVEPVILRVPSAIGKIAADWLRAAHRPYGVEVAGDPYDVFAPGANDHPLRAYFRWSGARGLREVCAGATSAVYVTEAALQRRYPTSRSEGVAAFGVSDVDAADEAFVSAPRDSDTPAGPPFRVIVVGTLEQLYKAPDVLIDAVARCASGGLDVELVIVGEGRHRAELEARARRAGIGDRVRFTGRLPSGDAVRQELDRAHLFVLPSRQEGLPRAMVEAMARGLPCLGTPVGGIPELLAPEALVPCDAGALAARIREIAASPELRAEMSRRNLERARDYQERKLQPRRERFHRHLQAATHRWAESQATGGYAACG